MSDLSAEQIAAERQTYCEWRDVALVVGPWTGWLARAAQAADEAKLLRDAVNLELDSLRNSFNIASREAQALRRQVDAQTKTVLELQEKLRRLDPAVYGQGDVYKSASVPSVSPEPPRKIDGKFSMKYGVSGGQIINTMSGEIVPEDEPLFLLRARDHNALVAIHAYQGACEKECNELHMAGIQQVREKFCQFAAYHPERMKQPGITKHLKLEPVEPAAPPPAQTEEK